MSIKQYFDNHRTIFIILIIVYIISAVTVIAEFILGDPIRGFEIPELQILSGLFGPSLSASILLIIIGSYLVYRYISKSPPRKECQYQLIWGIGFLIYSLLFVGLCLQSFLDPISGSGIFGFADMNDPGIFFIWRSTMIIWVTLMWIGTIMLFTEDKKFIFLPAGLIFIAGEVWFLLRLFVLLPSETAIEQTMYGFLFGMFIPMCIIIAYLFYTYSKDLKLTSAKLLTFGFSLLALTYAAWAPWHFKTPVNLTYIYFIWFDLFIVSLALIFAGLFALPKETISKVMD